MSNKPLIDEPKKSEDQNGFETTTTKSPIGLIVSFGICLVLAVLYAIFKG